MRNINFNSDRSESNLQIPLDFRTCRNFFFDGVAYYDSNEISTTDCVIRNNQFAGISLDNDLVDITFTRCQTESNGDVGVFARNVEGLQFLDCKISGSADWAVFLTHDLKNLGVLDTTFELCQFEENRRGRFHGLGR